MHYYRVSPPGVQRLEIKVGILASVFGPLPLPGVCQWHWKQPCLSAQTVTVAGTARNSHPVPRPRDGPAAHGTPQIEEP